MRYSQKVVPIIHEFGRELSLEEAREILPRLDVVDDVVLMEALCFCPTSPCLGEFTIVKDLEEEDIYPCARFDNTKRKTFWSIDYELVKEFTLV